MARKAKSKSVRIKGEEGKQDTVISIPTDMRPKRPMKTMEVTVGESGACEVDIVSSDPLEEVALDFRKAIALILWKFRFHNPGMTVLITDEDLKAYRDCVTYLQSGAIKGEPEVRIERDKGRPAAPGKEGTTIPGIAPRNFVTVALVEKGTWNAIRPVENNEKDYNLSQQLIAARTQAKVVAQNLLSDLSTGSLSYDTIRTAAHLLQVLSA